MKPPLLIYIIAFVCVFVSCSSPKYRKALVDADSLAYIAPKRAIAMLDSMEIYMQNASEEELMYYRLLCIKASDKAYVIHKSDSLILSLVEYYETRGDRHLLPEAYYYAGRVYSDLNDAPRALRYYQEALNLVSDCRLKGHLYFQTGNLLLNQALYNQAISIYKKSLESYTLLGDSINITHTLRNLAYTYNKCGEKDSAIFYYHKSYSFASKMNAVNLKKNIMAQMSSFYIEAKDFVKAEKYLFARLNEHDSIDLSPNYCMALKIYMGMGRYGSARFYAEELLKFGTVYAKQTASRSLTELALMQRDYEGASRYLRLFNEYTDSVRNITATETVNRMNSLYNYNIREKENLMLRAENSRKLSIIVLVISVTCIIVVISVTYIIRNRQKQKMQAERLNRMRKELFEQSEEYVRRNEEKIIELEGELKRISKENLLLADRIEEQRTDLILANEMAVSKQKKCEAARIRIQSSDIYGVIQDYIKRGRVLTIREWDELDLVINQEIDGFRKNLYGYYTISRHEYHVCMLIRIGIAPKDMAELLGCTASAVSKVRKRLQNKLFSDSGTTKDFDSFIKSL